MKLKSNLLFLTLMMFSNSNVLFAMENVVSDVVRYDDNEEPFETTRIPYIVWLMIGRHIDNSPDGLALGLVRLSLVNRDLGRTFTNGTIAEQLLSTSFSPIKEEERIKSLLSHLVRKNYHDFLATLLQKAQGYSDLVGWRSLGRLNQSFWFFIYSDMTSNGFAIGLAAQLGHVESLKVLLACGANFENQYDLTPLMQSAYEGRLECLKELIAARADLNATNWGKTALILANEKQHNACIAELIASGADILKSDNLTNLTSLGSAIELGNITAVELMLKSLNITGPDLDALVGEKCENRSLMTTGALYNRYDIIELIFKLGGSIDKPDPEIGSRPLMFAAQKGYLEAVGKLLKLKADVNAENVHSCTALMYASQGGTAQVVQKLLDNQANINFKNVYEDTALSKALESKKDEIIKVLLKAGVDLSLEKNNGQKLKKYVLDQNDPALTALFEPYMR